MKGIQEAVKFKLSPEEYVGAWGRWREGFSKETEISAIATK